MMAYFVFFICVGLGLMPGPVLAQDEPVPVEPVPVEPQAESQAAESAPQADPEAPPTESTVKPRVGPRLYVPRPELVDGQLARMQALAKGSDAEDVQWLQSPYGKFFALYKQEYTGVPKGGVIILHNPGQHADWPDSIAKLRQQLPEVGWTSLAISLPEIPAVLPPKRTFAVKPAPLESVDESAEEDSDEDNAGESNVDAAPVEEPSAAVQQTESLAAPGAAPAENFDQPYADLVAIDPEQALGRLPLRQPDNAAGPAIDALVTARLNSAIGYMQDQGLYNLVLIAQGVAASWTVAYVNSNQPAAGQGEPEQETTGSIQGVILIDAEEAPGALAFDSAPLMASLQLPIFDVLVSQQKRLQQLAKRRLAHARRAHHLRYKQLQLQPFALVSKNNDSLLVRRIRGWLKTQVQGQEVESYRPESS